MKMRVPLLMLAFGLILLLLFRLFPGFMDTVYSGFIYKLLAQGVSSVMALIPFSMAEIILFFLLLSLVYYIIKGVVQLFVRPFAQVWRIWKGYLMRLGSLAITAIAIFLFTCGLNYHRLPLEDHLGYVVEPSSTGELCALAAHVVDLTNCAAAYTRRTPEGALNPDYTFDQYRKSVMKAYDSLSVTTDLKVGGHFPSVKPVMASRGMSHAFVMGFFFPWTLEANVNKDVPAFWIPALIAHEQAHVRGFMREDEANFLTYLIARHTNNMELKYSCLLHSLNYLLGAVHKAVPEKYGEIAKALSPRVVYDLRQNHAYWEPFQSSFSTISQQVNDAYLRANGQKDGVSSYGKVVDLMIADYKIFREQVQQNPDDSVYIGEGTF
ncbi:MAG: DUF3810 domain-containing protein [Bacteroidales bacterium]|jgi:hypothetical protein|nr:DUF3810 domain-containing protein [Bacteroidales bacterium]MDD2264249.1 DUF3810 domain-containing protein [Bacteroidales bacterium]MDD2831483.1 DUF3810 domain-containing protein [Bacteroidales bacterium]MDD3208477.1 DUF3810 domain-containing protein [Bacteroidales bacterium]MDD3697110.1 DUF3810 domain-containing protein [Bacteroidales bacterium]